MKSSTPPSALLKTKQHYEILDGLRGIAAVSVVVFHFMEIAVPDYEKSFIAHAYLAVDFFFCLSGFVIAYAYDAKLSKIGVGTFFKLRLIRLHPLVIVGSVIGLLAFLFDPFTNLWTKYSDKIGWLFGSSCLMIPYPLVKERFNNLFHLNPPTWSLFWEYVANIFYAFVLVRARNKVLWVMVVAGGVWVFCQAYLSGNLSVGWSGETFGGGATRVFFSFLAGVLVYRTGGIIRTRLGFVAAGVLLLLAFLFPFSNKYNYIIDPVIVAFYFPLVVALGAGATLRPVFGGVCRFAGAISYPLYMVHYPFIWLFLSYAEKYKPSLVVMGWITFLGTVLLIGLAYVIMIFVDEPVRRYFKHKMEKGNLRAVRP